MKIRGWIYVITNKAMHGLVKIGYSTKDPHLRAEEFDGTGIPHPYEVVYDALLFEPREVEQKIHSLLKDKREGKEWFRCSVEDSINAIQSASAAQKITETFNKQIIETVDSEGTFLDCGQNIMWAEYDNESDINWLAAKAYCENYRGGGYSDWRMPTQDELADLYVSLENEVNAVLFTGSFIWAHETHGADAAIFDFSNGMRLWFPQYNDYGIRALPARYVK